MRFRNIFIFGGSAVVLGALLLTDPDQGVSTAILGVALVTPLLAVAFSHLSRRGLFDYLDMEEVMKRALESPVGAGLVFVGVCIVISALLGLFGKQARADVVQTSGIPAAAAPILPMLQKEISAHWPDHPMPSYFGGLVEHETACPRPSMCWKPTARLKTQREEGAGFPQLTRAWFPDGRVRFDALQEMRDRHPALRELDWATIYQRPDLQLRAMILKSREDWRALGAAANVKFVDLAHNAGRGRVTQDRRACAIKPGCNPALWEGHVELTCTASRIPIYGNRSACDICRHHVADVVNSRAPKYAKVLRSGAS